MKHLDITVTGLVQGVWFRASTKEQAELIGITGFVRNQADGSVYLEAEGSEEGLEVLVKWLRQGPSAARVDNLEIKESELQNFPDFEISS